MTIAACCKAVMVQHAQTANYVLSERLGAQGLFEYDRLSDCYSEMRGISIAEGDILGTFHASVDHIDLGANQRLTDKL
ncbi:uncharacterized protein EDB93DRAFT_276292 [Suillus bovinus]|uniref:uncharacterized protein n=1 Tax=Suillus bovinus TaxID=48563 RepID=UPI001B883276|nr:uncharacterized protein EDB93DRAFT_276292 [Suillus bovinus]KAG2159261.1 hypothetical protein EDB93DRAFT_276292 [Suillus bovinus]